MRTIPPNPKTSSDALLARHQRHRRLIKNHRGRARQIPWVGEDNIYATISVAAELGDRRKERNSTALIC
ncbi:protein of unknown function (plasmid) [Methylocella tundrae]|uniref:Uncharacterized protein n=1 Tax=Methylocella tundrae TaxID=227605 RepID=A0A4U8Z864_METTU|nr:protein of unknown function [Methylocella tundrae]